MLFFYSLLQRPLIFKLFPYTTLFRSYFEDKLEEALSPEIENFKDFVLRDNSIIFHFQPYHVGPYSTGIVEVEIDRKSTRLNSSHVAISYAVFCLKKKNRKI